MSNGLNILGSGSKTEKAAVETKLAEVFWEMEELENAFHFHAPGAEPLFLEFDELAAVGLAYAERGQWTMLDMLEALEKLAPDFAGVEFPNGMKFRKQRLSSSPGISLEQNGRLKHFYKNDSLNTINFLDFYDEHIMRDANEIDNEA